MALITRRDQQTGFLVTAESGATTLTLAPLGEQESLAMVAAGGEKVRLRPDELAAVVKRAGGNPLFLHELLVAAAGAGSIEGLPDSVQGVIASQIDRLSPRDRTVLRFASVLGMTFTERLLREMLAGERIGPGRGLFQRLGGFLQLEHGQAFRFRHALIRDVAYDGLAYRRRQQLHGHAGAVIEGAATDPDEQAELLSMHFFHAALFDKAWRYSVTAGNRARSKYANTDAAAFYTRAIEAARRGAAVGNVERAQVEEALGDVRSMVGDSSGALAAYAAALRLVKGATLKTADIIRKVARIEQRLGKFPQTLRWLSRGRNLLDGVGGEAAGGIRAMLAGEYAVCRSRQGRLKEALRWATLATNEAEAVGDRMAMARAYQAMELVHGMSGGTPDRPFGQLALALYEELGDLAPQAQVLNNMAIAAYFDGRWRESLDLLRRARSIYERVGDTPYAGGAAGNMGELLTAQGRVDEAEPLLIESVRVARAVGNREEAARNTRELGRGAARRGRYQEALGLLEGARADMARMGAIHELADTEAAIAECQLLKGDFEGALTLAGDAFDRARAATATRALPSLQRIRGFAMLRAGRPQEARKVLEDAYRLSSEPGTRHERAYALAGLAEVATAAGEHGLAHALQAEGRELIDALGVVSMPIPA